MSSGPCDWPLLGLEACEDLNATGIRDQIENLSRRLVWSWTARQFGLCTVTVRPARSDWSLGTYHGGGPDGRGPSGAPWTPVLVGGSWRNVTCGACGTSCSCDGPETVRLPGPVYDVDAVTIDGVELDPSAYRVDDGRWLVRDDGGVWPACQQLDRPAGEPGTWTVTYRIGRPVPEGGQLAAGTLACHIAKAVAGAEDCGLPQRVQTITRQGVTVAVLDPFEGLEAGKTGLWLVDAWVASEMMSPRRSSVAVPKAKRTAVTTYRGGL